MLAWFLADLQPLPAGSYLAPRDNTAFSKEDLNAVFPEVGGWEGRTAFRSSIDGVG